MGRHGANRATFQVASYEPFGEFAGAANSSPELYYVGAKWMNPELGRWYSLDPELGKRSMPQTMNRYVYCANNPLRFTDPTEMGFWDDAKKWWDKHGATVMPKSILIEIRKRVSGSRRVHGPAAATSAEKPLSHEERFGHGEMDERRFRGILCRSAK